MIPTLQVAKGENLLQLLLLNEATLVLVNDAEGLLDVIAGFATQADLSEEILVLERFSSCGETEKGSLMCVLQKHWLSFWVITKLVMLLVLWVQF